MTQSPNQPPTALGYTPPMVTQFSVFLDNRVGKLMDAVTAIEDLPGVVIAGLAIHEASDHAVARLITSVADDTKRALRERRLAFAETEVLVVEFNEDQCIGTMCMVLLGAELNIEFAYAVMSRPNGLPALALKVDDPTLGGQLLRRKGYTLLGESDLG